MGNTLQEMTQDMQARIRELAYMMWESAGRQQGMAVEYWLKAEGEVLSAMQAAATRMIPGTPLAAPGANPRKAAPPADVAKPAEIAAPPVASTLTSAPKPAARKPASRARNKT